MKAGKDGPLGHRRQIGSYTAETERWTVTLPDRLPGDGHGPSSGSVQGVLVTFWWTGKGFRITKLFHLSVMTSDLKKLHEFYGRAFGVTEHRTAPWFPHRFGSFTMIADVWIENVCPDQRWETPLRAQSHTIGDHWHSPGLYVDDMQDAVYELAARHDVRLTAMGTGAPILGAPHPLQPRADWPDDHHSAVSEAFTHPWDTGIMWVLVQFADHARTVDPRADGSWSPEGGGPLGIVASSHHTIVVEDPSTSVRFLADMCAGTLCGESHNASLGVDSTWVKVGEETPVLVEIARPVGEGAAQRDLARHNNIFHSTTFTVRDLDAAARHLAGSGIGLELRTDELIVTDPKDACGLRFAFCESATSLGSPA
jgi:catechol 2,3-dioxygenase-like lactoylglutathione lyase family enzyme